MRLGLSDASYPREGTVGAASGSVVIGGCPHTSPPRLICSAYVLMQVETLGEALKAGWRVHARCVGGIVDNTRSTAKCRHQAELDIQTLVWTRGRNMPLANLRERTMCPRCGNRRINLIFDPPPVANRAPAS